MEDVVLDDLELESDKEPDLEYGGFWMRFLAMCIDFLVELPFAALLLWDQYILKTVALTFIGQAGVILYKPILEKMYGATPGKMALGLKVVSETGEPLSWRAAWVRFVPWVPNSVLAIIASVQLATHPEYFMVEGWTETLYLVSESDIENTINWLWMIFLVILSISVAIDDQKRGLHDRWAKTMVVFKRSLEN